MGPFASELPCFCAIAIWLDSRAMPTAAMEPAELARSLGAQLPPPHFSERMDWLQVLLELSQRCPYATSVQPPESVVLEKWNYRTKQYAGNEKPVHGCG